MLTLLARIFIKNYKDTSSSIVRTKFGLLSSIMGIFFDVVLGLGKVIIGIASNSVAIMADGFNNLTDTLSAIISLFGFKFSSSKADKEHPFGHGRYEYIAGLIVSFIIIVTAVELFQSSVVKIIHPENPDFSAFAIGILVISILVKSYMWFYNSRLAKKFDSVALGATAKDSLSDCIATFFIIVGVIIFNVWEVNLDGYIGVLVSLFVFWTGFTSAKDTIAPLLGEPPTAEFVKQVEDIVHSHEEILGMHDLIVHNYGPGRVLLSLHAEIPAKDDILKLHDVIDNIEQELSEKLSCQATIHMDPIENDNVEVNRLKLLLERHIAELGLSFHDFRVVLGNTHTNLIFDVVVPFEYEKTDEEVHSLLIEFAKKISLIDKKKYYLVDTIERSYV